MTSQTSSQVVNLEAGSYWLCTCDQSKNKPYCDGSHKGTPFTPLSLELDSPKQIEVSR
jgi:CDGSH-type Zn-finger protein